MDRLLLPVAAIVVVVLSYRAAAARVRNAPQRRAGYIAGAIAALVVAALLVPWVLAKLNPPWSESPAAVPVLVPPLAMFYWLWRVRTKRSIAAAAAVRVQPGVAKA